MWIGWFSLQFSFFTFLLQGFDTVGWVSGSLQKFNDEVMVWLYV